MRARARLSFTFTLLLGACTQAPDLTVEIEDLVSEISSGRGDICMCAQDAGFESMVECTEATDLIGPAGNDCIAMVLEDQGDSGADYLACVTQAYGNEAACLSANVSAECEDGAVAACEQDRTAALAACTQVPASERQALDACIGS